MRAILLASAAMAFGRAFMSDVCEVVMVTIKGAGSKPVRVNKSDYDADQAEGGAKTMTLHKEEAEQPVPGGIEANVGYPEGITPTATPSAPDFSPAPGSDTLAPVIDPNKNAAAPAAPVPNQRLVSKEGSGKNARFFVTDGTGEKLVNDAIDPNGYPTDALAWQAVMALPH